MKVICIDNTQLEKTTLIIGKIYDVITIDISNKGEQMYTIDVGKFIGSYKTTRFIELSTFRNEKIDEILNT